MSDKLLHGTASYRDYSKLRYIWVILGRESKNVQTLVSVQEFRRFS